MSPSHLSICKSTTSTSSTTSSTSTTSTTSTTGTTSISGSTSTTAGTSAGCFNRFATIPAKGRQGCDTQSST